MGKFAIPRPCLLVILGLMALDGVHQVALADDKPDDRPIASDVLTEATTPVDDELDEVTVIGKGNLGFFRGRVVRAENDFYKMFNELTSDPDFRIICEQRVRHLNTKVKVRVCESKYVSRIAFEVTQRDINMGIGPSGLIPVQQRAEYRARLEERRDEQLADMQRALDENPEFKEKLVALHKAKADLAEFQSE